MEIFQNCNIFNDKTFENFTERSLRAEMNIELEHGKPAPDIYLEIMRRMQLDPGTTAVVEDSGAGIKSGKAAGTIVIAVPNQHTNPGSDVLALAEACISTLHELPGVLEKS